MVACRFTDQLVDDNLTPPFQNEEQEDDEEMDAESEEEESMDAEEESLPPAEESPAAAEPPTAPENAQDIVTMIAEDISYHRSQHIDDLFTESTKCITQYYYKIIENVTVCWGCLLNIHDRAGVNFICQQVLEHFRGYLQDIHTKFLYCAACRRQLFHIMVSDYCLQCKPPYIIE